jgi:hypothetical protein
MAGDDNDRGESFRHASPHFHILPPNWSLQGKTYGEWSAKWWKWAVSIPLAENPLFENGEFAQKGSGDVWFLAGAFGGILDRNANVPTGKWLFFPILNNLWWAPNDLAYAKEVAIKYVGLTPAQVSNLSDEELIGLLSNFFTEAYPDPSLFALSLTIDGVAVKDLAPFRKTSPGFRFVDTDLIDDLIELNAAGPIDRKNTAVSAGYWIMLAPLKPGKHEIRFRVQMTNLVSSPDPFVLDITYHLTVGPRDK